MVYKIVKFPDPILEQKSAPVTAFHTKDLEQLVADMFETMYASKGVGLAAPQIGISERITVIDCSAGEGEPQPIVLINPEVIRREGKQTGEEGCLSIPGFREDVTRAKTAVVRASNVKGETIEVTGQDLLARAMQHEIDHLNGILFLSHLSPLKRDLIKRKIKKLIKEREWIRFALRLIYLGTPPFAVPTLEAIIRAGHEVLEVISQPDRPKGRGHALAMPAVKTCALAHGLPVFQPERIRRPEVLDHLRALAPEVMVVVGYGQIIPQTVIDIALRGILNVHGSLLPRLRGAAPAQWAIARGDLETGVTTMQIDAGLDTGDMLLSASTAIGPNEDAVALGERLSHMGATLLVETLSALELGTVLPRKQDSALATYAPILKKQDGRIDWTSPAQSIHNRIRGMQPWPGAHSTFRGQLFQIWISHLTESPSTSLPGQLLFNRDGLFAGCGDGLLLKLIEVQLEGRKKMSADDFARGHHIGENEKLGD